MYDSMPPQTVNFVFGNLNPCGGGERLTLATMLAMLKMGINSFDLTTFDKPRTSRLNRIFGNELSCVMRKINNIHVISLLDYIEKSYMKVNRDKREYDITINTQGDKVPYFHRSFSKNNSIVYCHFPTAKNYIEMESVSYLQRDLRIEMTPSNLPDGRHNVGKRFNHSIRRLGDRERSIFKLLKRAYSCLMRKSTVITNSQFSRKAIMDTFKINGVHVLSPPVDVETFSKYALQLGIRRDTILVISRIDPDKQIENALNLAQILKKKTIGKGLKIVGTLIPQNRGYFDKLHKITRDLDLKDYVTFETNVSLEKLLLYMSKAKVYFHPMIGEHFGISVAEAMAAGLAPVVPSTGGPTEFVSKKYQYDTLEEAAHIISSAFKLTFRERLRISNSVLKFSASNYIDGFRKLFEEKFY
jgi:glycosyltransferase involved in cell wall biosynthesis